MDQRANYGVCQCTSCTFITLLLNHFHDIRYIRYDLQNRLLTSKTADCPTVPTKNYNSKRTFSSMFTALNFKKSSNHSYLVGTVLNLIKNPESQPTCDRDRKTPGLDIRCDIGRIHTRGQRRQCRLINRLWRPVQKREIRRTNLTPTRFSRLSFRASKQCP